MHNFFRSLPLFFSLLLLFTISCKEKEEAVLACGCNGPVYQTVENEEATYLGDGYFVIGSNDPNANGILINGWACNVDTTWKKSPETNVRDYIISAKLKKYCPVNDIVFPRYSNGQLAMMEVTALRKK